MRGAVWGIEWGRGLDRATGQGLKRKTPRPGPLTGARQGIGAGQGIGVGAAGFGALEPP